MVLKKMKNKKNMFVLTANRSFSSLNVFSQEYVNYGSGGEFYHRSFFSIKKGNFIISKVIKYILFFCFFVFLFLLKWWLIYHGPGLSRMLTTFFCWFVILWFHNKKKKKQYNILLCNWSSFHIFYLLIELVPFHSHNKSPFLSSK